MMLGGIHRALPAALVCLMLAGCGGPGVEAYIPSPEAGKKALEDALNAWKAGQPMATISRSGEPSILPQDTDWKAKKQLASYTVVNEIPTTEGPKQFAVRLTIQGDPKAVDVTYYVVGNDPLWIFRDVDYKQAGM